MTTEQKRAKLIMHYKTMAQIALGAVSQLEERKICATQLTMGRITAATNQRIKYRLVQTEEVWRQQELPI